MNLEQQTTMALNTPLGAKVIFNHPQNGWDWDHKAAARHLKIGNQYTVADLEVGGSESYVMFEEVPGIHFNTVLFSNL